MRSLEQNPLSANSPMTTTSVDEKEFLWDAAFSPSNTFGQNGHFEYLCQALTEQFYYVDNTLD